jgi:hypothetical protein
LSIGVFARSQTWSNVYCSHRADLYEKAIFMSDRRAISVSCHDFEETLRPAAHDPQTARNVLQTRFKLKAARLVHALSNASYTRYT